MTTAQQVDQRVEAVTGRRVASVERIAGGDIGQAWKVEDSEPPRPGLCPPLPG